MKKRVLLTALMVMLFTLALALCTSAATFIYNDAQGNEVYRYETEAETAKFVESGSNKTLDCEHLKSKSGNFARKDENGVSLTWYITATTTDAQGNTVYTVACIPTLQTAGYDTYAASVDSNGKLSYKSPVTNFNIVSIDFPNDANIKTFSSAFGGYGKRAQTRILYCYFPNTITTLPGGVFQETPVQYVEFEPSAPLSSLPVKIAHGAFLLEYMINIPSTATTMPGDGNATQNGTAFYLTRSLISVTFGENSKLTKIGETAFIGSGVKYITLPDSVTTVDAYAFSSCYRLETSPFSKTSKCTTWGGRVFDNSNIKEIIIPAGLTNVSIFGSNDHGPFSNATVQKVSFGTSQEIPNLPLGLFARGSFVDIEIPEGPTYIPNYFFCCATIKEVKFPNTVKTAGHRVFLGATVEKIRFGASFESFVSDTTDHLSFTHQAKGIKEIYLPASFYKLDPETKYRISYAFAAEGSGDIKFFYTGSASDLATTMENFKKQTGATDSNYKFLGATQISYYDDYFGNEANYEKGNYIIYGYNLCDAFYESIHEEDNNACVINCDRCKVYGQMEKEPVHIHATTIKYENGYTALGVITSKCQNEGCVENTTPATTVAEAIFGAPQYALKKEGIGIVFEFEINTGAVSVYNEIAENDLEYGVLAVFKDKVNEPFVNGEKQNGVASIQIPRNDITRVDFVIIGEDALWNTAHPTIENKTTKDRELYMLAYVKDANGVSYFNDLSYGNSASNVGAITYNSLLARTEQ